MNKRNFIYVLILLAVLLGGVFVFSYYFQKQPTSNSTSGVNEQLRQDALLGSIATSTDGKLMIYTNKKYKFSFSYPTDWIMLDTTYSSGHVILVKGLYDYTNVYNYKSNYKIEMYVGPASSGQNASNSDYNDGDNARDDTLSTTTMLVNGVKVIRYNVSYHNNTTDGEKYIISYRVPSPPNLSESIIINSYNFGTSTVDFSTIDNLVKSIEWLQ